MGAEGEVHGCLVAASATALQNTPESVPGPPSSSADQRLERLGDPRLEGQQTLLATLCDGALSAFHFV